MPETLDSWESAVLGGEPSKKTDSDPWEDAVFSSAPPENASVGYQVRGAMAPPRGIPLPPENTKYRAALAKMPLETQYNVAKGAKTPYTPGASDTEIAVHTAMNAPAAAMVQNVARLPAAFAEKVYSPAERSNLEDVANDKKEPAWKRNIVQAWLDITGPGYQEQTSQIPAQSAAGAAARGVVSTASSVLPYVLGPEAVAGKAAMRGAQFVAKAGGVKAVSEGLASRLVGDIAFFSGAAIPSAAEKALKEKDPIGFVTEVIGAAPEFAKQLAEAPVHVGEAVRRGMAAMAMNNPSGWQQEIKKVVEASGPWAVIAALVATKPKPWATADPEVRAALLTPKGAAALWELHPELAERISSKEYPGRSDIGGLGVKLTSPERAQLADLLRQEKERLSSEETKKGQGQAEAENVLGSLVETTGTGAETSNPPPSLEKTNASEIKSAVEMGEQPGRLQGAGGAGRSGMERSVEGTEATGAQGGIVPENAPPKGPPRAERGEAVSGVPSAVGLSKSEIEHAREYLNLGQIPPPERDANMAQLQRAKEARLDESAMNLAKEAATDISKSATPEEFMGMVLKRGQLENEFRSSRETVDRLRREGKPESAEIEQTRLDSILEQYDLLTRGAKNIGTARGRQLQSQKAMIDLESFELLPTLQRAGEAKGVRLTPEENARFEDLTSRIKEKEQVIADLQSKFEAERIAKEKAMAERHVRREARRAKITERTESRMEPILRRRNDAKQKLLAMGFRVNEATGLAPEALYQVGRLASSYIEEGAVRLSDVVQKVLSDIPDITERDVWDALNARNPKAIKKAKSEAQKNLVELKKQAKLQGQIEDAAKGIFDKPIPKNPSSSEVMALRKQLANLRDHVYSTAKDQASLERALKTIGTLQDQLRNGWREIKERRKEPSPSLRDARETISNLRREIDVTDQMTALTGKLEAIQRGEYVPAEKPQPRKKPVELEMQEIELKKLRREVRLEIAKLEKSNIRKVLQETINLARTIKATADMSATLRQALMLSARRPITATTAFGKAFQAFFSQHKADQIDNAIRSMPEQYLRDKGGLQLADLDGKMHAREEFFMSGVIEKVPVLGRLVRASNRHMATMLNLIRTAAFDDFARKNPNATSKELAAWADFVNAASGRGDLGKATEVASYFLFAPRFAASRIQAPWKFVKYIKEPRVRKEIAKDLAAFGTLGATALTLAKLAGAQVGLDPRDSDFGKIVIGDKHIDLWAGFQQPARLLARTAAAVTDKIGLTGKGLLKREKEFNGWEVFGRFGAFKLAPHINIPFEWLAGRDVVGQKVTLADLAANAALPILVTDIMEAYKKEGVGSAAVIGTTSFFGAGSSTYHNKPRDEDEIIGQQVEHLIAPRPIYSNYKDPEKFAEALERWTTARTDAEEFLKGAEVSRNRARTLYWRQVRKDVKSPEARQRHMDRFSARYKVSGN